jgi:ribosome-binding factor A
VTVTGVEVTPDLRHARVFVSVMGSESEKAATFDGLASTASHLRSRVGRALRLRVAPEFQFREDDSIARAARIESLLAEIRDTPSSSASSSVGSEPSGEAPASPEAGDGSGEE